MENKLLNIVFWGEDAFSNIILNSLIEAGHKVILVVTPYYENLVYKKLKFTCNKYGISLLRARKINSVEVYQTVKAANPDLCVISHFERLIKEPLLSIPRLGFINLHPSLLPDYRGMAPQHWPIINGEKETGITIHRVDEGADTGDIILQRKIVLGDDDYVSDLQKKWMVEYKTIMVEAIEKLTSSDFVGFKQSHLSGRYYGKLTDEQCIIDESYDIDSAYRLIRGVSMPYHGAQWKDTILWKAHKPTDSELNEAIYLNLKEGLTIQDKKGYLKVKNKILIIDKFQKV